MIGRSDLIPHFVFPRLASRNDEPRAVEWKCSLRERLHFHPSRLDDRLTHLRHHHELRKYTMAGDVCVFCEPAHLMSTRLDPPYPVCRDHAWSPYRSTSWLDEKDTSSSPSQIVLPQRPALEVRSASRSSPPARSVAAQVTSNPDPYDPFFIPHGILFETPTSLQHGSALLQLPEEILTLILEQVKIPYFQVCFALTCKTMSRAASRKGVMAPWRGYRDKEGLFRLLERHHYIPQGLRLCRACFLFKPRSEDYWAARMDGPEFESRSTNWGDIIHWFEPNSHPQHRCPSCCASVYTSYMSERIYQKETTTGDVGDTRAICPELTRRVNKP